MDDVISNLWMNSLMVNLNMNPPKKAIPPEESHTNAKSQITTNMTQKAHAERRVPLLFSQNLHYPFYQKEALVILCRQSLLH